MKQYFMKGVDEPLEFGDTLGFDLVKKGDEGQSIIKHVECTFIPEIVPLLLEEEVIEEKEVKDKPEPIDFSGDENPEDTCDELQELQDKFDNFTDAIAQDFATMQMQVKKLSKRVGDLESKWIISENNKVPPFSNKFTTTEDYFKRNKDIFKPIHTWNPNVEIFGFAF